MISTSKYTYKSINKTIKISSCFDQFQKGCLIKDYKGTIEMLVSIAELIFAIVILTSAMAYLLIGEELALNKVKNFWILESQVELKTYFIEKNNI